MMKFINNRFGTEPARDWRALHYFNAYRIIISSLFVALIWIRQLPEPLGVYDARVFSITAHLYLAISVVIIFFINTRRAYLLQVSIQTFIDIVLITLMMYASNGLSSGFGMLLVITVAGCSLLSGRRIAIFFAALATIAVLGHELYVQFFLYYRTPNYTHAGLLGITFFITATLGYTLASRVARSEALVKQHAIELANLAQLNEYIVQRLQSGILVCDNSFVIRLYNESALTLLGVGNEINNRSLHDVSPELQNLLIKWLEGHEYQTVIFTPPSADVEIQASFTRHLTDTKFGILIFLEDVGVLRQRAQQMKLVSLGRLAASIAHEVRNPLGAVAHAGQLLSEAENIGQEENRLLHIINEQSKRVNTIIQNVEMISRRQPSLPQEIRIDKWLTEFVEEFVKNKSLTDDAIECKFNDPDITVKMDVSQFYQVLWNICENALRYSHGQKRILISCAIKSDTHRPYIDIRDFGSGMSKESEIHLFEPFFTTNTGGTGLGLYISRELCEANQASLSLVENTPDGCCFRISFPYHIRQQEFIQ